MPKKMRRFIETTIWTQNEWFVMLESKYKLLWFYMISNCDNVGVLSPNFIVAERLLGEKFPPGETKTVFASRVVAFDNDRKWWIKDFVVFQYGILSTDSANKPHKSYLTLLIKHSLLIPYQKSIEGLLHSPKDKDKDSEQDTGQETGSDRTGKKINPKDVNNQNWVGNNPPAKEDVVAYAQVHIGSSERIEKAATAFYNHFKGNGWMKGKEDKVPMVDWHSSLANFISTFKEDVAGNGNAKSFAQQDAERMEESIRKAKAEIYSSQP